MEGRVNVRLSINAVKHGRFGRLILTGLTVAFVMTTMCTTPVAARESAAYRMGQDVYLTSDAATRYIVELKIERSRNPIEDPQQLQGRVKSKYFAELKGMDARIVVKYFLEAVESAENEDRDEWFKAYSKHYEEDLLNKARNDVIDTLEEQVTAYHAGTVTMEQLQQTVAERIDEVLKDRAQHRTSVPFAEAIFSVVKGAAMGEPSLADQLAILETMKKVNLPEGYSLMSSPGLAVKYYEAQNSLKELDYQKRMAEYEVKQSQQRSDTSARIVEMAQDAANHKLGSLATYLRPYEGRTVDYVKISDTWKQLKSMSVKKNVRSK